MQLVKSCSPEQRLDLLGYVIGAFESPELERLERELERERQRETIPG
jgi:hypothetical protein